MNRILYLIGFGYIALCASLVVRAVLPGDANVRPAGPVRADPPPAPQPAVPPELAQHRGGAEWFAINKPYCNPVEVDVRMRYSPPPRGREGAGYSAACFALAGKIDRAR